MDYRSRLYKLAKARGIRLHITKGPATSYRYRAFKEPGGFSREGYAEAFNWDGSQFAYLSGLHELAHNELGHFDGFGTNYFGRKLEAEAEAWEWAFEHAGESLTDKSRRMIWDVGLGTYVKQGGTDTAGPIYDRVIGTLGVNK